MFRELWWRAAFVAAVAGAFACRADKPVPRKLDETPAARDLLTEARKIVGPGLDPGSAAHYRREGDRFFAEVREEPVGTGHHARVLFPWRAAGPVALIDADTGVTADLSLVTDDESTAALAGGLVIYPKAGVLRRAMAEGFDDYVILRRAADPPLSFQLALGRGVVGLRLVGGQLEVLDGMGAPRLRLTRPAVIDASGHRHDVVLSMADCAADDSPKAPWGAPVTVPGSRLCTIALAWAPLPPTAYPIAVETRWTTTGSMATPREDLRALTVSKQRVVAVGGVDRGRKVTASVELFDAETVSWAIAAPMHEARTGFTLTDLGDGRLLATGGRSGADAASALATAELYDVAAGAWTATAQPMGTPRVGHTATSLTHGSVLVAGGEDNRGFAQASAQLYTPSLNRWDALPPMSWPRTDHAATRLPDGEVLVAGGESGAPLAACELYEPARFRWLPVASLGVPRSNLALERLRDGFTAVAVGGRAGGSPAANVEWFNTRDGTWSVGTPLAQGRDSPVVSVLGDGSLVVTGGSGEAPVASTEVASSAGREWGAAGTLTMPRTHHAAVILGDGKVLVIGGRGPDGPTGSAEIVTVPVSCTQPQDCATGFCVDGYCCSSACDEGPCDRCDIAGQQGICGLAAEGEDGSPSCKPFTCSGLSVACVTSCADDTACATSNFCQHGDCLPTYFDGLACSRSGQCESGYCSRAGVCAHRSDEAPSGGPLPPPEPPRVALRSTGTRCEASAECATSFCVSGRCCSSACDDPCGRCDAPGFEGVCAPASKGTSGACEGLLCDGTSVACPPLCGTDSDCEPGSACSDGECLDRLSPQSRRVTASAVP